MVRHMIVFDSDYSGNLNNIDLTDLIEFSTTCDLYRVTTVKQVLPIMNRLQSGLYKYIIISETQADEYRKIKTDLRRVKVAMQKDVVRKEKRASKKKIVVAPVVKRKEPELEKLKEKYMMKVCPPKIKRDMVKDFMKAMKLEGTEARSNVKIINRVWDKVKDDYYKKKIISYTVKINLKLT